MWIWIIIAAVLITVAWVLVWLIGLLVWIAALATAVCVLTVGIVFLVRILRARHRAAALERELLKQAEAQADRSRPDRRNEILTLQAQMRQAIQALKKSRIGGGGGSALYALPWYVIVGPPAAGKTTALEQSGLAFTSPGTASPKIRGTAGTRNCDWWFSQHAILLDTAGRFATEQDDQDEWFAFLDTVKRFRPGKPLDGVLVAVSVTDLVGTDETHIEDLAQKLRARVDEMMNRLEMVLPVYVLVTKADLIAGFVEFWGDANKQQRGQAWGATFRLNDERLAEPGHAVLAEFDVLMKALHSRLLDRLPRERLADARTRILQFPVELQLLRIPIAQFVEALCTVNPYEETPILRGFYFTSGTQVGRPMDHVLENMVRGFNIRVNPSQTNAQSQSYFVTELFKTIIFPDRNIAERSGGHRRRQLYIQLIAGAVAALLTIMILVVAVLSYLDHSTLVRNTIVSVDNLKKAEKAETTRFDAPHLDALSGLLDHVQRLREERDRIRLPGWLNSGSLYEPAYRYYIHRIRSVMEGPVRDQVRREINSITTLATINAENFASAYDDLKLYAMMAAPEHLDLKWAKDHLLEQWTKAGPLTPQLDADKVAVNTEEYLNALAADHTMAWPPDEGTLAGARRRICQQPIEELQYATLAAHAKGAPAIGADKIFYGPAAPYLISGNNVEVPGLYTKAGWDKVREVLQKPEILFTLEPWVCGGTAREIVDVQTSNAEHLREMYFDRYQNAWTQFFRGLELQSPTDLKNTVEELRALEGSEGPYARLFRTLSENAQLEMGDLLDQAARLATNAAGNRLRQMARNVGVDAGGPTEKPISPVEKHFKPLLSFASSKADGPPAELVTYLTLITNLEVQLSQLLQNRLDAPTQYQAEVVKTRSSVERLFGRLEGGLRGLVEPLLMAPIKSAKIVTDNADQQVTEDRWKTEVYNYWHEKLSGKYPFSAASQNDVTLLEFADFFRPAQGVIWKHFETNLAKGIRRTGNTFSVLEGAETHYRPDLLRCLDIAAEITDAVFGTAVEPAVAFAIKMQPAGGDISEITLQIDGQARSYRNEPERWIPAGWPAKDAQARGGVLIVRGAGFQDQIPRMGDFGFFRLMFEAGAVRTLTGTEGVQVIAATWTLTRAGQPPIVIQIKPNKAVHPFRNDFFRRLACPDTAVFPSMAPAAPLAPGAPRIPDVPGMARHL